MSAASDYRHVDEIARLTRERDAAIAQLAAEREAGRREGQWIGAMCYCGRYYRRALRDTPAEPETGRR